MKITKIISLSVFTFALQLSAQTNFFQKTTWKIESISTDGKAVLKKVKRINLPSEQSKFHYLQFENEKFDTGNSCFHMNGHYNVYEPNTIEFSEGAADMVGGCEEPKSLRGNYSFILKKDSVEFSPIEKIDENVPRPDVANQEVESVDIAVETAEKATSDLEKSSKKVSKKSTKKIKK